MLFFYLLTLFVNTGRVYVNSARVYINAARVYKQQGAL